MKEFVFNAVRRLLHMINERFQDINNSQLSMDTNMETNNSDNNHAEAVGAQGVVVANIQPETMDETVTESETPDDLTNSNDTEIRVDAVHVLTQPQVRISRSQQARNNEGIVEFSMRPTEQSNRNTVTVGTGYTLQEQHQTSNESRLNAILCCTVCLELPVVSCYQCTNGHLMCEVCLNRILADAHLEDKTATCPSCRCEMTLEYLVRNLAVEKAIAELPAACRFCQRDFERHILPHHQASCFLKPRPCRFAAIGCQWKSPAHELKHHEEACPHTTKSGEDVAKYLELKYETVAETRDQVDIFTFLSLGENAFADIKLKPYYTESVTPKLFYETSRFTAFNRSWMVRAKIISADSDQTAPLRAAKRSILFQLVAKSRLSTPVTVHFFAVSGPNCEVNNLRSKIHKFECTTDNTSTDYVSLEATSEMCDALLANPEIYFRLMLAKTMA